LLFHAGWRPRVVLATRPFRDWHLGTLEGSGHQVGTMLDVENPPSVSWWGEGDEKITVDGEPFPACSAPEPRTTSASPGRRRRRSPTPTTPRPARPARDSPVSSR